VTEIYLRWNIREEAMIRINLLGDDTALDTSGRAIIAGYMASLMMLAALLFFVRSSYVADIETLTIELNSKTEELKRLEKITKEVKDLETKEAEYNNKIGVIANLKRSKLGPVRILDDLNTAVPQHAWVTQVKEEGGLMRVDGKAIDNQTIASFMRSLDESDYVRAVDLGETRQSEERNAKITMFSLSAQVSYAGSAKTSVMEADSEEGKH
jgi:type IV pilus assembly protein PilN